MALMNGFKNTPAPWHVVGYTRIESVDGVHVGDANLPEEGTDSVLYRENLEIARHNAWLMAMAPSLKTFLQEATEVVLYYYPMFVRYMDDESEVKTLEEMTLRWKDVLRKSNALEPLKAQDFGSCTKEI